MKRINIIIKLIILLDIFFIFKENILDIVFLNLLYFGSLFLLSIIFNEKVILNKIMNFLPYYFISCYLFYYFFYNDLINEYSLNIILITISIIFFFLVNNELRYKKLNLVFFNIFLLILFSETSLIFLSKNSNSFFFLNNSMNTEARISKMKFKPGTIANGIKVNSKGFVDKEFKIKKGNKKRIIVLGNSQAVGIVKNKYNFIKLVEEKFEKDNMQVEFYNMSVPSIDVQGYFTVLTKEGLKYDPDGVIIVFSVGTDMFLNEPIKKTMFKPENWILFKILISLNKIYHQYYEANKNKEKYSKIKVDRPGEFSEINYAKIVNERVYLCVFPEKFQKMIEKMFRFLGYINKIMKGKIFVIIIPEEYQIDDSVFNIAEKNYKKTRRKIQRYYPQKVLNKFLLINKIDNIDLLNDFKNSKKALYFKRNTHLNIEGNKLISEKIYLKLKKFIKK